MKMYQEDYIQKNKDEYDKINYSGWLYGQYMIPAVQKVFFGKKAQYPKRPYLAKDENTDDDTEIDAYEQFRRSMRAMNERIRDK
jgi:hypothetical protein